MRKELQKVKDEIIGGKFGHAAKNQSLCVVRFCPVILNEFIFPPLFYSLYSRAAEKKHIVLLHVRCNGGAWRPEGVNPPAVSSLPPCCSPGISSSTPVFFLFCFVFFVVLHTFAFFVTRPTYEHPQLYDVTSVIYFLFEKQ